MEISFPQNHTKVWGYERWLCNNEKYCGKILVIEPFFQCSVHYHKKKHETFFILSGGVFLELEGDISFLYPGNVITIEPGKSHRFTASHIKAEIIEISTQHFEEDSFRTEPSKKLTSEEFNNLFKRGL